MTKPRRTKVKFGGTEIPELFTEKLRGRVVYYFKNDKGNKIRREDLNEAILELNKFKQSINMPVIPLLVEEGAINQYQQDKISEIEQETGTKIYPDIRINRRVPVHKQDSEGRTRRIEIDAEYNIPKEWLLDQFKQMLAENPKLLSQEVGVEELSYLPKLKPKKRYTLKQIGEYYLNREKYTPKLKLKDKNRREAEQYWKEFIKVVEVRYVDELDKTILNKFNSELAKIAHEPQYRPKWLSKWQKGSIEGKVLTEKWIKVRLDIIKTVFKNALNVVEYVTDIENALRFCKMTFYNAPLPKQIVRYIFERQHIEAIFNLLNNAKDNRSKNAYIKWTAVILLALNCAFTPIDFRDLQLSDINFQTKELAMVRKKKNTERYAVLWGRTVLALQDYLKIRPQSKVNPHHIFLKKDGGLIDSDSFCVDFKNLIKKVNAKKIIIPAELTFKFFRKSAASSAERAAGANPSEVKYLLGHSAGIMNHYTHRAADLVGNVCRKIEQDYFG